MIAVSYSTDPPPEEQLRGLTNQTTVHERGAERDAEVEWRDYLGTAIVLALLLTMYIYFSVWA